MKDFIEKIRATEIADVQEALMGKDDVPDLNIPEEAKIDDILKEIWDKYDTDKNGTLNKSEARVFVKEYLLKLGEGDRLPLASSMPSSRTLTRTATARSLPLR